MKYLLIAVAVMSVILFAVMGVDKYRAKHHKWRVPERTLMLLAAVGGAAGGCLGMLLFRHKTQHLLFVWGFPILLILQAVIIFLIWHFRLLT